MSQLRFQDCPVEAFKLPRPDTIQYDNFKLYQTEVTERADEPPHHTRRKHLRASHGTGGYPTLHSGRVDPRTGLPAKDHNLFYTVLQTQAGSLKVPTNVPQVTFYEPSSAAIEKLHSLTGTRLPPTKERYF